MIRIFIILYLITNFAFAQKYVACVEKSAYASNWECLGPYTSEEEIGNQHTGVLNCMSVNPNNKEEIYVGCGGGLWYTSNRGKTWECLTDNFEEPVLNINAILVDYTVTPHCIIAATGLQSDFIDPANVGILKSNTNGNQWKKCILKNDDGSIFFEAFQHLIQHPNNNKMLFSSTPNGKIYRSKDFGDTWETIVNGTSNVKNQQLKSINSMLVGKNRSLFITNLEFYKSENGINKKLNHSFYEITNCDGTISNSNVIDRTKLFLERDGINVDVDCIKLNSLTNTSDSIYLSSTLRGSNILRVSVYSISKQKIIEELLPTSTPIKTDIYWFHGLIPHLYLKHKFYIANQIMYYSTDTLKKIKPLYAYSYGENNLPHADVRNVTISKYSEDGLHDEMYLCTDGGLSYSDNSGKDFINLNGTSLVTSLCHSVAVSPFTGNIAAGMADNGVMSYIPNSKKWIVPVQGDGYDVAFDKQIPKTLYSQYNYLTLMKSTNDLAPGVEQMGLQESAGGNVRKTLKTLSNGSIYFSGTKIQSLHINKVWENNNESIDPCSNVFDISEADTSIIYRAGKWTGLYKSVDGGHTFQNISANLNTSGFGVENSRIQAICISPYNANEVWIGLGYIGNYINICEKTVRLLHSINGGNTWEDYSLGLPVYSVTDIQFLEGTHEALFAATFNGIYFRPTSTSRWTLFSNHFPKCAITDVEINYYDGKILAATFGRGIWQSNLPDIAYTVNTIIKKNTTYKAMQQGGAKYSNTSIKINKNATLTIDCELHMAKDKKIFYKKENQLKLTNNGKIIYH